MNSNLKIELNGTLITGRIDGIENFVVTYQTDEKNGNIKKSYSSELTFYDDGYNLIKTDLIDDPIGFSKKITVKIYDDCCADAVFEGIIMGDGIDWCEPGCYVSANIIEDNPELSCVQNTLIYDNWDGFFNRTYQPVYYCIENRPVFLHLLIGVISEVIQLIINLIVFAIIPVVFLITGFLYAICIIIRTICNGFSFTVLGVNINIQLCNPPNCNGLNPIFNTQRILDLKDRILGFLDTCGSFHPSPYVRDYINNVCKKCGLNFQSSILNDSGNPVGSIYYNTVLFSSPVKRGRIPGSNDFRLIQDNKPILTLETFLNDYLCPTFNAKWKIFGNTLVFERKDYFKYTTEWIDTESLLNEGRIVEDQVCFNWSDKKRYSYGRYEYQPDAMEYIGNESKNRYNDIIEWNNPYTPSQTGEFALSLPFSPASFDDDGDQVGYAVEISKGVPFSSTIPDRVMLMAQHQAFNYRLLIVENDPQTNNLPRVKHDYSDSFCGGSIPDIDPDQRFNYPYWFYEGRNNNLYSLFHYIDDPRSIGSTQFDFKFTFEFKCEEFQSFGFEKYVRVVKGGQILNGEITELSIDFNRRTIQVSGIV